MLVEIIEELSIEKATNEYQKIIPEHNFIYDIVKVQLRIRANDKNLRGTFYFLEPDYELVKKQKKFHLEDDYEVRNETIIEE